MRKQNCLNKRDWRFTGSMQVKKPNHLNAAGNRPLEAIRLCLPFALDIYVNDNISAVVGWNCWSAENSIAVYCGAKAFIK